MTKIVLVCPGCRHEAAYEEASMDLANEITCSVCGFSDLPSAYELLTRKQMKQNELIRTIAIIVLAGIVFVLFGLSVIVMAALFVPIIIAAVVIILWYQRRSKQHHPDYSNKVP